MRVFGTVGAGWQAPFHCQCLNFWRRSPSSEDKLEVPQRCSVGAASRWGACGLDKQNVFGTNTKLWLTSSGERIRTLVVWSRGHFPHIQLLLRPAFDLFQSFGMPIFFAASRSQLYILTKTLLLNFHTESGAAHSSPSRPRLGPTSFLQFSQSEFIWAFSHLASLVRFLSRARPTTCFTSRCRFSTKAL